VIRFSAGLVVVAIGVLIGGVATSKLSLVYVAIAVSAVALVVLAIGVALKRDELFGGGPELAPAGAGAGSGMPAGQSAGTGHVQGSNGDAREDQPQILPSVPGPATAAFAAAAAASAASASAPAPSVAAPSVAAPPVTTPVGSPVGSRALGNPPVENPPLGQRRPAFSQASTREADSAADWQTRPAQPPWSSGDQGRPSWTAKEPAASSAPSAKVPSAKEPQSGVAGSASASPRAWAGPEQPPTVPAAVARAGSVAAPSWFDKLNQPVADSTARTDTEHLKSEPSAAAPTVAAQTVAAQTVAAPTVAAQTVGVASDPDIADDDDWPTRYSWLEDDESDEAGTSGKPAALDEVAEADEVAEVDEAAPDEPKPAKPAAAELGSRDEPEPLDADSDQEAEVHADPEVHLDTSEDPAAADDADLAADSGAEPAETLAAADREDQPPAEQQSDARLVTVIPGVPRYHDPDCILIRFMDEDDVARKSIPEAKAANCTPCVACQPEG
jgi:hypothetical protein